MNDHNKKQEEKQDEKKTVVMNGVSTYTAIDPDEQNIQQKVNNIMANTPNGYDPLVYWHQVAMDAIKSGQSAQNAAKQARDELGKAQRSFDRLSERIAQQNADYRVQIEKAKSEVPFDLSRLVGLAGKGTIDLNVTIQIKGKGRRPEYEHEDEDV